MTVRFPEPFLPGGPRGDAFTVTGSYFRSVDVEHVLRAHGRRVDRLRRAYSRFARSADCGASRPSGLFGVWMPGVDGSTTMGRIGRGVFLRSSLMSER
jgi:hypothetical protein